MGGARRLRDAETRVSGHKSKVTSASHYGATDEVERKRQRQALLQPGPQQQQLQSLNLLERQPCAQLQQQGQQQARPQPILIRSSGREAGTSVVPISQKVACAAKK